MPYQSFMKDALAEARKAAALGEVPVGCVIVHDNLIIARAGNRTRIDKDPSAHAEILALRQACQRVGSERLPACDLYVTLEPCAMCAAALSYARIRRLYFGAEDDKAGAVSNTVRYFHQKGCHHRPEIYQGFEEEACRQILLDFFREKR
jgi:tRNA(adenine34) deaminase